MPYSVTEPHPSVRSSTKTTFIGSGIGGAGNYKRYTTAQLTSGPSAAGPASRANLPAPPTTIFSGRGGAGNVHKKSAARPSIASTSRTSSESSASSEGPASPSQRAIFSFDEELEREQRMRDNAARVYHIGRGGAGNAVPTVVPRKSSSAASSVGSSSSNEDGKRRSMMERISRTLSRN
ncbi:hypothetical protein BDZ85DRAFT_260064 [Elsinoe ampelina]|uniref:Uncharacterized protein n=1 Tax=Elsinoe ampelina TaxID=302913 RepID=A0A6A6GEU7_9PEZI|nr:hypothetical protein BDZ85DRAFT_260064 [Elsinoe ampelina]